MFIAQILVYLSCATSTAVCKNCFKKAKLKVRFLRGFGREKNKNKRFVLARNFYKPQNVGCCIFSTIAIIMDNKHIIEYLDYYIKSENTNFAVLLKGSWGSGKTFFVKKMIDNWSTPNIENDEFIALNPIYISLNGLSSKKEIIEKLKEKINPFLHSKGMKISKAIFKGFIKSTLKIDFDYDKDNENDGSLNLNFDPISIFKEDNEKIKGNRIIIFDDIERCKIEVDEVYGFINDFVEHSKCKIILVSDEDKIINNEEKKETNYPYSTFKEKIIGQTFEISPNIDEAIDYFVSQINSEINSQLVEYNSLIIKIFNTSDKKNLRVLQRALFDFERLVKLLDKELKEDSEKYKLLVKSLLTYYLIFHLEFNTGNSDIENFQQLFLIEEKKFDFQNYEEAIKSENLIHSTRLFSASNLVNYISKGNYEELVKEINNNLIYKPTEEKDWEKLWYWKLIEDSDFVELLPIVEREFFEEENIHFTEVLHIAGIYFNLIDNNLYSNKTKEDITKRAKHLISISKDLEKVNDMHILLRGTWRKSYASENTIEFQNIVSYLKETLREKQKNNTKTFINSILYNLNDENIDNLYDSFKGYDYYSNDILERTSIFKDIKPNKFSDIVFNLKNKGIFDLNGYFNYRYYPEKTYANLSIESYHKEELNFIRGLRKELVKKSKTLTEKPLKLSILKNFINDLEKISLRLN